MSNPPPKGNEKIGKFYNFDVTTAKFERAKMMNKKLILRHFLGAMTMGFLVELLITRTRIYENIIARTTMKRLEAKRQEDENLRERKILLEKKKLQGGEINPNTKA